MSERTRYLIDADVFIQAKNAHYAFSICPGFWDSLVGHYDDGHVSSIDHIKTELLRGDKKEDLVLWVKNQLPRKFFHSTADPKVVSKFQEIMLWVQRNSQFTDPAKAKFATEADGWLAAYADVHGFTVVTGEQLRPDVKSRVPLPNVCAEFGVPCRDVFLMLKDLSVQFEWKKGV